MRSHLCSIAIVIIFILAGCGGSTITGYDPPAHSAIYITGTTAGRIFAPPGTADAGTEAIIAQLNISAEVSNDGSFSLDIDIRSLSRIISTTLIPPLFSLLYVRDGLEVREDFHEADRTLASLVEHQLFSTGSGPNDMIYAYDSFYVANSLDNTVTRHSSGGELLATGNFAVNASPSFLGYSETDGVFGTSNGDNRFFTRRPDDLSPLWDTDLSIVDGFAFPGPGQPLIADNRIMIPYSLIESFSPTVYADAQVETIPLETRPVIPPEPHPILSPAGVNAQFAATDILGNYFVVSTGDIQFDESWSPYAESDSYITKFETGRFNEDGQALNLGPVGAGRIAVSPDGNTAYLGNSLNGNLYKVDLTNLSVLRGAGNPIVLTEEFTFVSDVAFTPDGRYLLATSFNTDELYLIDTATDTVNPHYYPSPFDLSLDPDLLAGAMNVEVIESAGGDGFSAYVLFGVANTVARIDLI